MTLPRSLMEPPRSGSISDAFFGFDRQGRYTAWSEGLERLSGIRAGEVLGRVASEIFPIHKEIGEDQIFHRVLRGEFLLEQNRPRNAIGDERVDPITGSYYPVFDATGDVIGGFVIVRELNVHITSNGKPKRDRGSRRTSQSSRNAVANLASNITNIELAKRIAQEVREFEQRFRQILEGARLVAVAFNKTGGITFCNDYTLSLTGWKREDVVGRNWFEMFLPPNHRDIIQHLHESLFNFGYSLPQIEYLIRTRHGEERLFCWDITLLRDERGEAIGAACIGEDITERNRADERLRSQVQFSSAVLRSVSEGICVLDTDGRIILTNPAAERLLSSVAHKRILGMNIHDGFHQHREGQACRANSNCPINEALLSRTPLSQFETLFARHDGHTFSAVCSLAPFASDSPSDGSVLTLRDISERKRAEAALRESEEQFRRSIVDAPFPIAIHTENGQILQLSKKWTESTGYSLEEFPKISDWFMKVCLSRSETGGSAVEDSGVRSGGPSGEHVFLTRDGRTRVWDFQSASLHQLLGGESLIVSMATDVTEHRRMEKTLRHLAKQLTSAQEDERRRISRELHDEAGQTITTLSLGLQSIQQTLSRLNVKDESLTTALRDMLSLADSVHQSLRRIAHSLHPAALEYFGLSRMLQSFLLEIGAHSGKVVSVDISRDFPRLSTTIESTVYRIVQEAVSNALKHAAAQSLKLTLRATDNQAMIRFEDDGRGFEKSSLEEFGGIGLISMRERAEMVAGEIEIVSAPGEGTQITLYVPILDSRLEDRHLILNLSQQS